MKTTTMYLCDFGYGIMRYDIARLALNERIAKDGTYEGQGLASEFDFRLLEWTRKVKKFLEWDKVKK